MGLLMAMDPGHSGTHPGGISFPLDTPSGGFFAPQEDSSRTDICIYSPSSQDAHQVPTMAMQSLAGLGENSSRSMQPWIGDSSPLKVLPL